MTDHSEVFTAEREVNTMLDLVKQETERIDRRFLEPACGDGNFLAEILRRKLTVVKRKYKKSPAIMKSTPWLPSPRLLSDSWAISTFKRWPFIMGICSTVSLTNRVPHPNPWEGALLFTERCSIHRCIRPDNPATFASDSTRTSAQPG